MQHDKEILDALNRAFKAECDKLDTTALPDIIPSERFTKNMERMMRHKRKPRTDSAVGQKHIDSAGKASTITASSRERILQHSDSMMQSVMGTLATAAVIAIVVGFGTLIYRMDRKPGTADSSLTAADSTEPAVTATRAEILVDGHDKMPVIPEEEQNYLGGRGEIVTVTPARGNAAHPVLRDDMFLYWDQYRTCIEKDAASVLTHKLSKEYTAKYQSLLSDGTALYCADDKQLFGIDSKGSQTPLYTVPEAANMIFTQVLNLGAADGTDPWYFISGYRGMDNVNAVFPFAMVYQPATDTELDLTDRIGMSGDAQWEFQTDGTTLIGLDLSTNTLLVFPHPAVVTDPVADRDITEIALPDRAHILSWQLGEGTVTYVCGDPDKTMLCEYALYDGTTRTRELDMPSADAILTPEKLFRVTQNVSESDSSLIDIRVTMTDWDTLMNGGEELGLWVIREMKPEDVHALRAAGDDVVLFYPATGQRALYAPFWADESS